MAKKQEKPKKKANTKVTVGRLKEVRDSVQNKNTRITKAQDQLSTYNLRGLNSKDSTNTQNKLDKQWIENRKKINKYDSIIKKATKKK